MYPQTLLSQHFWTDEQKSEFSAAADEASKEEFQSLLTSLKKTATKEQLDDLSLIGNQVRFMLWCLFVQTINKVVVHSSYAAD